MKQSGKLSGTPALHYAFGRPEEQAVDSGGVKRAKRPKWSQTRS